MARKMKAAVFVEPNRIVLDERPVPDVGPTDALIRVTTTTICGTDIHILKGEYPVERGLIIGHEPVGVIEKLGSAVQGYREGQRVIAGAITPSGQSYASLAGFHSQSCATGHGWKPMGGWRFGNTIDGCQAEYVRVPDAMATAAADGPTRRAWVLALSNTGPPALTHTTWPPRAGTCPSSRLGNPRKIGCPPPPRSPRRRSLSRRSHESWRYTPIAPMRMIPANELARKMMTLMTGGYLSN